MKAQSKGKGTLKQTNHLAEPELAAAHSWWSAPGTPPRSYCGEECRGGALERLAAGGEGRRREGGGVPARKLSREREKDGKERSEPLST